MDFINILKQELTSANFTYEHALLKDRSVVDRHLYYMVAKLSVLVDEVHGKFCTLYWFPKLYEGPYKSG